MKIGAHRWRVSFGAAHRRRPDPSTDTAVPGAPRCFLHIPKCAGSSVHAALSEAYPPGAIAPRRFDTSVFCGFSAFERLSPEIRAMVAASSAEVQALRGFSVVCGHFCLPSLLTLTPASMIATVVREPRSRLLSTYAFWRATDLSFWAPYDAHGHARQHLGVFLSERVLAPMIDNQLCRLLLHGDRRLPERAFARPRDVPTLAADALERARALGFVGVHELPEAMWSGLSAFFGVHLEPRRVNVTTDLSADAALPTDEIIDPLALERLAQHTAADGIVYRELVSRSLDQPGAAAALAEVAFARQLVRLGTLLGRPPRAGDV